MGVLTSHPLEFGTRLRRGDMDAQLAEGVDPSHSRALRERAARLTSVRKRQTLASGLQRALAAAGRPTLGLSAAAPIGAIELGPARLLLDAASKQLRSEEPVSAQGVVLIERLLTDPAGPLYRAPHDGALTDAAASLLAALHNGPQSPDGV